MARGARSGTGGWGAGAGFLLVILAAAALGFLWSIVRNPAPQIRFDAPVLGLGSNTVLQFRVRDARHRLKSVGVEIRQNGRTFAVSSLSVSPAAPTAARGWSFGWRRPAEDWLVTARIARHALPELQPGRATLVVTATNDAWGRFFRGGRASVALDVPVRWTPPQVEVLTAQHYINQGGSEMVIFAVSPGTVQSGVEAGKYFFPSWPVQDSAPQTRLCLFAFPYDLDPSAPVRIVARDDAGNQTVTTFPYKLFPQRFHTSTLELTDPFLQRVVPPIMSQMAELDDQGSLLKDFLLINGHLRQVEAGQMAEFSKHTSPHFLWTQPFIQLGNTKVEAHFADDRTYLYRGQVVDHQTHLGFDLAGTAHMPAPAANDGQVVFAGFFGIYGNAVIIDHGCGLQTLYGHLSQITVKAGERVQRGQLIGHSGETGLAGGDHLHFTVLLDGVPVNPVEWWDPHWIRDRITAKLAAFGAERHGAAPRFAP